MRRVPRVYHPDGQRLFLSYQYDDDNIPIEDVDIPRPCSARDRWESEDPYAETSKLILEKSPKKPHRDNPENFKENTYIGHHTAESLRSYFKNVRLISAASELASMGEEGASASGPVYNVIIDDHTFVPGEQGGE